MAVSDEVTTETPTRVRYGVLGFACALSMITYLDRVCYGSATGSIIDVLGPDSETKMKWTFTAFAFAYAAFEVPSGWLGDVFGPRSTLIRIVLWWSVFTALTGCVGFEVGGVTLGIAFLVIIRFLFGMGEAGAYPNITRAMHNWFPFKERGFTQGMVWMSGRLMGGLTPLIWSALVLSEKGGAGVMSWRGAFWLFGIIGLAWCLLFTWWFRNHPDEKPEVNLAERNLIQAGRTDQGDAHSGVPWKKLLSSSNLWALCLMYFCGAYGWYFNITYLPRFLETQHTAELKSAGEVWSALYKGGPLLLGAIGCLSGGFFTDWFIRRTGNQRLGRRLLGIVGHFLCAGCYFSCLATNSAFTFALAISLAAFCNDLTMGSSWATCQDIGRKYAAIVAGCMNTIGNLGGAVAGWATGTILEYSLASQAGKLGVTVDELNKSQALNGDRLAGLMSGYEINFISFGIVYLVAVLCWLKIDASKPVVPDQA